MSDKLAYNRTALRATLKPGFFYPCKTGDRFIIKIDGPVVTYRRGDRVSQCSRKTFVRKFVMA